MFKFIKKISTRLENMDISLPAWAASFFAVSLIRNFFEGLLEHTRSIGGGATAGDSFSIMFLHYNLEWLALLMVLVLIFYFTTKTPVIKLLKITLAFYSIIIIVPFIDFFAYYPKGSGVLYLFGARDYARCLLYFFAPNINVKVSAGVRIEVFIAVIFSFLYVLEKTRGILRPLAAALLVYFFAVSSMCFPVFSLLPVLPFKGAGADAFISRFFSPGILPGAPDCIMIIFLLFILMPSVLYLHDAGKFKLLFSLYVFRSGTVLYPALVFCGFFMAAKNYSAGAFLEQPFTPAFIIACLVLGMLIFTASSMLGDINGKKMKTVSAASLSTVLFLCVTLSLSVSFPVFLIAALILAVFAVMNLPPFTAILPKPAKACLGALSCFMVLFLGFTAVYGADAPKYFTAQNLALFSLLFASVTAAAKIKNAGFAGRVIISAFVFSAFLIIPVLYRNLPLLAAGAAAGLAALTALNARRFEKHAGDACVLALAGFMVMFGILA